MLKISDLNVYYGAIQALNGVCLEVNKGEIVTMIGGNGAGKSTAYPQDSGLVRTRGGEVEIEGQSIHACPPHKIVTMGIGQGAEGRRVFSTMSVRENLDLGAYTRHKHRAEVKSD